jgi:1-phosphatidylinositol-4-phosphate 5-kinase
MGKSGSFFFFSHDDNFLIKTMTLGDFNAFKKIFLYYFEHVNTNQDSLLARIYGVYSVKMGF